MTTDRPGLDWTTCPWCSGRVWPSPGYGPNPMMVEQPGGDAHAAHCPKRVRSVQLGRARDPVQKLIPAAAKMREPITVRAKR